MKKTMRGICHVTLGMVFATTFGIAGADVIFDNGGPGLDSAWLSGYTDGSWYEVFDDFVLTPGANVITDIHWWGVYNGTPPALHDFGFHIFEDIGDGSGPARWEGGGIQLDFGEVSRELVLQDRQILNLYSSTEEAVVDVFAYDYVLQEPLVLPPGRTYWLNIILGSHPVWFWEASDAATGNGLYLADGGDSGPTGGGMAFQLTGPRVIPEPASMSLLGAGLLTWLGARRPSVSACIDRWQRKRESRNTKP